MANSVKKIDTLSAEVVSYIMSVSITEGGKVFNLHHSFPGGIQVVLSTEHGLFIVESDWLDEDAVKLFTFELDGKLYVSLNFQYPDGSDGSVDIPV